MNYYIVLKAKELYYIVHNVNELYYIVLKANELYYIILRLKNCITLFSKLKNCIDEKMECLLIRPNKCTQNLNCLLFHMDTMSYHSLLLQKTSDSILQMT